MVTGAILAQQNPIYSRCSKNKAQKQQEQSEKGKNGSQLLSGSSCSPHNLYSKINQFPELQFHKFRQPDALFLLDTEDNLCWLYYEVLSASKSTMGLLNHQEIKIQKLFIVSP